MGSAASISAIESVMKLIPDTTPHPRLTYLREHYADKRSRAIQALPPWYRAAMIRRIDALLNTDQAA